MRSSRESLLVLMMAALQPEGGGYLLPTPTQRLDLKHVHPISQLDQATGAVEELGAEIGKDAEGEDIDLQIINDLGQLVDLADRIELGLVADQVVDPLAIGQLGHHVAPEVELLIDLDGIVDQAQTR